jgi:hypothetical protein
MNNETILLKLASAIRSSSRYNPDVQVAPDCILWPDKDRQWEAIIPRLQNDIPELFVLGEYDTEKKTGPAIWLRCVIANQVAELEFSDEYIPILYLPGIGRQDLRAVENCQDQLKPLAELQYRGVIWSQLNSKDWTILAFLKSDQGGLGLDVSQDDKTKSAMQMALYRLLDEKVDLLRGKKLEKDYFNTLMTGGDPIRDLLQWLDQGDAFRDSQGKNEWIAFTEVCKSQLAFDPENDGLLEGAAKLAEHTGPWKSIWERFCEAPSRYSNIPNQIRKVPPPTATFFWQMDTGEFDGWPQWNEDRERVLRSELKQIGDFPAHEGRKKLENLAKEHVRRKSLVWAELGYSPLAKAVEYLSNLAKTTSDALAAGTVNDLANEYQNWGWKADEAVLKSLAPISSAEDLDAVSIVIRSIYLPWKEESALYLQNKWETDDKKINISSQIKEECVLFIDGLRFDCAKRLIEILEQKDLSVEEYVRWSALPSLTGTGKYVAAPIDGANYIKEEPEPYNFEPFTNYEFKKALNEKGWTVAEQSSPYLEKSTLDAPKLWAEYRNIDHEGHDRGWKLAKHLDAMFTEIGEKINELVSNGWKTIRIVTDHGWLLLPGGLPKTELASALTENKWGRCASIKPGAECKEKLFPWYWNPNYYFAFAEGISCYKSGQEYTHGGLSLQECLLLDIVVKAPEKETKTESTIEITDVVWKGLRCNVAVDGNFNDLLLDIRTQAGNETSSIVMSSKPIKDTGIGSVVIEDEDLEGSDAVIVLLNENGQLMAQVDTIIGLGSE